MARHRDRDIAYSEDTLAQLELLAPQGAEGAGPADLFREAESALQAPLPSALGLGGDEALAAELLKGITGVGGGGDDEDGDK